MKKMTAICLLVVLLLAGCRPSNCTVAPAPEATESVAPAPEIQASTAPAPGGKEPEASSVLEERVLPTPDEQAAAFVAALGHGDIDAMKQVSSARFSSPKEYRDCWKTTKVNSASYVPIEVWEQSGLYALTLDVAAAGETLLKKGVHEYRMEVGYPHYSSEARVLSITPQEKYVFWETVQETPAMQQVHLLRQWYVPQTFATPAQIDKNRLMDYLVIVAGNDGDPAAKTSLLGDENGATQAQIDAAAKKWFGLDSAVYPEADCYNKTTRLYELWPRDGYSTNERIVRMENDAQTGNTLVYLETYQDSLQVVLDKTIQYTLSPNTDGSYRFVSAVEVEAL